MANTTNFGWETPDDTDLVKDGAAAIRTLGSAIDTSLVDLKGGTTGQVLSKATGTDMDFTWVAQDDSNAIQNAIIDAKGDLIVGSAADTPARLAVGTNGYTLVADSSTSTGLAWSAPASGGGLTLLSTTTLSGTTVTVSSISGSYKNLRIFVKDVYGTVDNLQVRFRLNNDTNSNYAYGATGVRVGSGGVISNYSTSDTNVFFLNGYSGTAYNNRNYGTIFLPRYTDTARQYISWDGYSAADSTTSNWITWKGSGVYNSSAAITDFTLYRDNGSFAGGTLYIYGEN